MLTCESYEHFSPMDIPSFVSWAPKTYSKKVISSIREEILEMQQVVSHPFLPVYMTVYVPGIKEVYAEILRSVGAVVFDEPVRVRGVGKEVEKGDIATFNQFVEYIAEMTSMKGVRNAASKCK